MWLLLFVFGDPATTAIYTLSLHDALPISVEVRPERRTTLSLRWLVNYARLRGEKTMVERSEEHTSELQSRGHLVCRLLLEKKKNRDNAVINSTSQLAETHSHANAQTNTNI